MKIENHKIGTEITDSFQTKFIESPNHYSTLEPKKIIIHSTEGPNTQSSIDTFKEPESSSAHLIISRDGKEVIQMVTFNKRAHHMAWIKNNIHTIGIELDYSGWLTTKPHAYKHMNDYPADKRIMGFIGKDPRIWPIYPVAQLETLYQICRKLIEEFPNIDDILGHEDLEDKTDPGPAFPMTYFREKLLGNKQTGQVLLETSQAVDLQTSPREDYQLIPGGSIAPNKGVAIIDDKQQDYALVEVMEPENGNEWLVGWVPKTHLKVRKYQFVIKDHLLFGQDENQFLRQYEFIPAHKDNFGPEISPDSNIQFLVMHYTAATSISSTVNHFTQAFESADQRVSAHLLIGRDGRVVQFVPFNFKAYHAGFSYWEGLESINNYSIGIEMVNAGLIDTSGNDHDKSGTEKIPEDQIEEAAHWRNPDNPKFWHKYTPIQIEIAKDIAKSLKERYTLKDILGHDEINLKSKIDPGPLLKIEEWREELFGRSQPDVERWKITENDVIMFVNQNNKPQHPNHKIHKQPLKMNTDFTVDPEVDQIGSWQYINANNKWGWVRAHNCKFTNSKKGKIKRNNVTFYMRWNGSKKIIPPIKHHKSPLKTGEEVRIQIFDNDWALIANLPGGPFFEGWVKKEILEKIE